MTPILIFSGSAQETNLFAGLIGLLPLQYRHVFDVNDVYGWCNGSMLACGSCNDRSDAAEILKVAHQRGLNVLGVRGV